MRLQWQNALTITLDHPTPEGLARIARLVAERLPVLDRDSWSVTGIESLDHLSLTTDFASVESGLVTGVRHRSFDGEVRRVGFAVRDGVVRLDSIVIVARVRGDSMLVASPGAVIEGGEFHAARIMAEGGALFLEGSELRIAGSEMSAEVDRFAARLMGADVEARGTLSGAAASPAFDGAIRLTGLRFPGGSAEVDLKVALTDLLAQAVGSMNVTGGRVVVGDRILRPSASRMLLEADRLRLATPLRLEAPGLTVVLEGAAALTGSLAAMAANISWSAVAEDFLLPGTGGTAVRAGHLEAGGRGLNTWTVDARDLSGEAFTAGRVVARSLPGARALSSEAISAEAEVEDVRFEEIVVSVGRVVIHGGKEIPELSLRGTAMSESIPYAVVVGESGLALTVDERTWSGPIRIAMDRGRVVFATERIEGPGGFFTLQGSVLGEAGLRAAATFDARVEEIVPAGVLEHWELASVAGRVRGEASWGETVFVRATVSEGAATTIRGPRIANLGAEITWVTEGRDPAEGSELRVAALSGRTEGGEFSGGGVARWARARPVSIEAHWSSHDFDLAALAGFDTRLRELSGFVDAEVQVSGEWSAPVVSGQLAVKALSAPVPGLGVIRDATGSVLFENGGAVVQELKGRIGEGTFVVTGRVAETATDLRLVLDGARLRPTDGVEAECAGELRLTRGPGALWSSHVGVGGRWRLEGVLAAQGGRVLLDQFSTPRFSALEEEVAVEALVDLALDIDVAAVQLIGRDLTLAGKGRLAVTGTEKAPQVTGLIVCDAGRLVTRNATFRVREARIVLPEDGEITVTAHAAARIDRVRIFADVSGPISEPRITLTSNPARSEAEIVTMLAVGQDVSEGAVVTSMTEQAVGSGLALPLANVAGGGLGSGLGLESLRFEKTEGDTGSAIFDRVTIGGYVSDRVYLGYTQRTGNDAEKQIEVEYEINPELFVRFEAGDRGTAGGGLEWRRDY